jgi:hypothetical protein
VLSNRFEQQIFSFAPEATAYKLKKAAHNKRASPRKNSTGEKTGSGGVLQVKGLIRKSSVVYKAGVCTLLRAWRCAQMEGKICQGASRMPAADARNWLFGLLCVLLAMRSAA